MSCIVCGGDCVKKMLDELDLAYLIIDRDHCVKASGKSFRHLSCNKNFETNISLYSGDIGVFSEKNFHSLIESVFISDTVVKSVAIDSVEIRGVKKHLTAGFYPFPECCGCSDLVLIIIKDDTENLKAYDSINELNRRLHIINEIISLSASTTDPAGIINTAVRKTVELLNFDAGTFYCLDEDRKTAKIAAYYGLYEMYFPSVISEGDGMYPFLEVYCEKKPVYAEQYLGAPHDTGELGVFSTGCVPVISDDLVIGSLNVATSSFHKFTLPEKETIEALGRQIGGIIRLANLQQSFIKSNEDANLYLDIMMHDINNANTLSAGYLGLMDESCDNKKVYAEKALCGVEQSINIIKNISIIRSLRENQPSVFPVSLDRVIKTEIAHFPDVNIQYKGCRFIISGDELLSEVFVNLFGNSVKFGGDSVCIEIIIEDKENFVEVSVTDNGPGISDEVKPVIFDRFFKGKLKKSGKGLGLSIVRMILERYESTITVSDRIKGKSGSGAKFTFMLKKA